MINLKDISKSGLRGLTTLHYILMYLFTLIIPCAIIMISYGMIGETTTTISGIGIVLLVVFSYLALVKLKKEVNEKISIKGAIGKARMKAIFNFICALIFPAVIILVLFLMKDNFELAFRVIKYCAISLMVAALENFLLGSSVDRENAIRSGAEEDKEKALRKNKV